MEDQQAIPHKDHTKAYLITWAVVIYVGSLVGQFASFSPNTLLAVWGLLIAGGVVFSTYFLEWDDALDKRLHMILMGGISLAYLLALLLHLFTPFAILASYGYLVWWSGLMSLGYVLASQMTHRRGLFLYAVVGLVATGLFFVPVLAPYTALLFGLTHATLLLFLVLV